MYLTCFCQFTTEMLFKFCVGVSAPYLLIACRVPTKLRKLVFVSIIQSLTNEAYSVRVEFELYLRPLGNFSSELIDNGRKIGGTRKEGGNGETTKKTRTHCLSQNTHAMSWDRTKDPKAPELRVLPQPP